MSVIRNDLLAVERPTQEEQFGTKVYFTRWGHIMFVLSLLGYAAAVYIRIKVQAKINQRIKNPKIY